MDNGNFYSVKLSRLYFRFGRYPIVKNLQNKVDPSFQPVYIYIYIYIHTHTHTYIYIYTDRQILRNIYIYKQKGRIYLILQICGYSVPKDKGKVIPLQARCGPEVA